MYSRIDKRFYAASLGAHLIAVALLSFASHTMDVVKMPFLVYGVTSDEPLCAFFKPLPIPLVEGHCIPSVIKQKTTTKKERSESPIAMQKDNKPVRPHKEKVAREHKKPEAVLPQKNEKSIPVPGEKPPLPVTKEQKEVLRHKDHVIKTQADENAVHHSGNPYQIKNKKLYRYQRAVEREVARVWKPPLGIAKGTECALSFILDHRGKVKDFKVVKPSAVPLYDLSVIKVVHLLQFDEIISRKRFIVTFRQ